MRQMERKQLGLAVAALMLCFTSLVPLTERKNAKATAAPTKPNQTLSEVCHIDPTDDRALQIARFNDADKPPLVVVRRNDDPQFAALAQAIHDAVATDGHPQTPALMLVLYERNGQPDYRLIVTKDGYLFDPASKQVFQTNAVFRQFMGSLLKPNAQAD